MSSGVTVDQLKAELAQTRQAIADILATGQSYSKPGFSRTAANLTELREHVKYLTRQIDRAENGIASVSQVGPNIASPLQQFDDPTAS